MSSTVPRIRVLIADDHAIVREGLAAVLAREPDIEVVGEAGDGVEAVAAWCRLRPDVTLLDLRMPGGDGVTATATLRALDARARIVILTTYDGDDDVARGLTAGAAGYLLKDVSPSALAAAVRRVHRGDTVLDHAVAGKLAQHMQAEPLTPREREVLEQLGRGLSNRAIGDELGIGEGTVKLHMKSLLAKLDAGSRAEALVIAVRRGFLKP